MKYNVFSYLLGEGFRNVFKNKKSTIASLTIMLATMIIFGVFFSIIENIDNMMHELELSHGIQVFIQDEATEAQVKQIGEDIKKIDGVNDAVFVSKEEGFNQLKQGYGEKAYLLEGFEEILPVSYIVTFTDLALVNPIQEQIQQMEFIKNIRNREETTTSLMSIGRVVSISSIIILAFLVIVSIFIISNTIKLTVDARRKEISIMKYVGATNSFIRWPFIVEGIIIGLISAMISLLAIGVGYNVLSDKIAASEVMAKMQEISILGFNDIFVQLLLVYVILGIGIGVVGSSISMKKYLEV